MGRSRPWVRRLHSYVGPTHQQPCIQDGVASLSICKPGIRRKARVGDVVARFRAPKPGAPVQLDFVGLVSAVVSMGDYFGSVAHGSRRDGRLYTPTGERATQTGSYDRDHWTWGGITEAEAIRRDWSGKNVLLFAKFCDAHRGGMPEELPPWARPALAARGLFDDPRKRRGDRVSEIPPRSN